MADHVLYWGEIHNHNEMGYGQGSLDRSYGIARSHLDFYAFTPHAQHVNGAAASKYEVVRENWGAIQKAAAEYNEPGRFTTFLGYEWHSNKWGHVHIVYFDDDGPLRYAPNLAELQSKFRGERAMLVPHHIGYLNGVDWDLFDEELSPVIEIYSEHGCCEKDGGPFPMLGHSGGPGGRRFTAQHGLSIGKRFGFTAGTDNHDGYPGGYGLGLTGVYAEANTREAILDAVFKRRTIAVTGDRIAVDLRAGDSEMGSVVSRDTAGPLRFEAEGWDAIREVELIRNNVPVWVSRPDPTSGSDGGNGPYRLRVEWGWGPMKGYQVFDWEGRLTVEDGELQYVVPCFVSDPFDDVRRKRILEQDRAGCRWQTHTSRGSLFTTRNSMFAVSANDALCLQIDGDEKTRVALDIRSRTRKSLVSTPLDWGLANASAGVEQTATMGELLDGSLGLSMGKMRTWALLHRAVVPTQYRLSGEYEHSDGSEVPAYYYVRATQENGQMAWSSSIWIEE